MKKEISTISLNLIALFTYFFRICKKNYQNLNKLVKTTIPYLRMHVLKAGMSVDLPSFNEVRPKLEHSLLN